MKLRELAHSRTGDKGNISNISLIAFNEDDYPLLREKRASIFEELSKEEAKFKRTLEKGLRKCLPQR